MNSPLDKPKYLNYLKYPKMVLQQGGVQDIYSFQIGMNPQILNLTMDLGRFAARMAPQMEDLWFHANLE